MRYRLYMDSVKSEDRYHNECEDRYMFSEISFMKDKKIKAFVVADGMGGLSEGAKAAQIAVKTYMTVLYSKLMDEYMNSDMKNYSLKYSVEDIRSAMISAICEANEKVCKTMERFDESGTTISAVSIIDDVAVVCNVGDSPVYYYNSKLKKTELISVLQTKAEEDVKAGIYERYSRAYYSNEYMLYCYLGEYSKLSKEDIESAVVGGLQEGDVILAGTDGAFGNLRECDISDLLNDCPYEEEAFVISRLFEYAREYKDDDQTAIMYRVSEE